MNFKTQAEKLESLLEEELKKIPLVVLAKNVLAYKKYKIKQDKKGLWILFDPHGDVVDKFRIKTTASLAAKFYDQTNLRKFNEIKILDSQYWNNHSDSVFFEYRYKNTQDLDKRDLFMWRWEVAQGRVQRYKHEISVLFKANF